MDTQPNIEPRGSSDLRLISRTPTDLPALLLASLERRWQKYQGEVARCQRKCSEKSVHDLRVATRRLIAVIDVILTIVPHDPVRNVIPELRKRLKAFGPLRDVQVQMLRVNTLRQRYPVLKPFFTVLLLREKRLIDTAPRVLQKADTRAVGEKIAFCRRRLSKMLGSPQMHGVASLAAAGAAAAGFAKSVGLLRAVTPHDVDTIHRLRIAFKKFRYLVETLQAVLPFVTEERLKLMNTYQDRMGAIQDNEVLRSALRRYTRGIPGKSRAALTPVKQALVQEHRELVETFLQSAEELYTFWDGMPEPLFPPHAA